MYNRNYRLENDNKTLKSWWHISFSNPSYLSNNYINDNHFPNPNVILLVKEDQIRKILHPIRRLNEIFSSSSLKISVMLYVLSIGLGLK